MGDSGAESVTGLKGSRCAVDGGRIILPYRPLPIHLVDGRDSILVDHIGIYVPSNAPSLGVSIVDQLRPEVTHEQRCIVISSQETHF